MRLPDPSRSRALLIGTSTYRSDRIDDLPAVRNNVDDLLAVLVDPDLGGMSPDRCIAVHDPAEVREVFRALIKSAGEAEDTLLLYFAGHGLVGQRNELYLALTDTEVDELEVSALPAALIRDVFARSTAKNGVLILDCCFAGRAIEGTMAGSDDAVLGQIDIEGTYTLASTRANAVSIAPPGARYTAFTGELLSLLRSGVADGPELLTLRTVYPQLYRSLARRRLPLPDQRNTGTVDGLALVRNASYRSAADLAAEQARQRDRTAAEAVAPQTAPPEPSVAPAAPEPRAPAQAPRRSDDTAENSETVIPHLEQAARDGERLPAKEPPGQRAGPSRFALGGPRGRIIAVATAVLSVALSAGLLAQSGWTENRSGAPRSSASPSAVPRFSMPASGAPVQASLPAGTDPQLKVKPIVRAGTGSLPELVVTTLVEGTGPKVRTGQTVTVNYVLVSYRTGVELDSSWMSKTTYSFPVGVGQLIQGWDKGLPGARVGSRVQLDVPASMAYGETPSEGQPAGPLRFVVDVLAAV